MTVTTVLVGWIMGDCWKCEKTDLPVTWVGPAQWCGQHAPIYLCETCLTALTRRIQLHFLERSLDFSPPVVVTRPYTPALSPLRNPMKPPSHNRSIQVVSVSFGVLGVRVRATGRTGREAWRMLRRENPWLMRLAATWVLLLTGLAVGAALQLMT